MKKVLLSLTLCISALSVSAQSNNDSPWTLNTFSYTTNYWTGLIFNLATDILVAVSTENEDSVTADRIVPDASLIFPIGIAKDEGSLGGIRGPYDRAFSNPFKHPGDFAIGVDASFQPSWIGAYGGLYYKSQEVVFKGEGDNMRGYYIQPRFGLQIGSRKTYLGLGAFYDAIIDYSGREGFSKKALESGWGMDISFNYKHKTKGLFYQVRFSLPLHNFFNEDYTRDDLSQPLLGAHRKVAYLMFTTTKTL